MANELKFGWRSSESLTAEVYKADTTLRETGITMTETGTSGVYFGTPAAIVAGDTVIIDDGTNKVGFGEYQTGVNCELIEGDGFVDTLIGADGDTLETLSDEIDEILLEQRTVLNRYDDNVQGESVTETINEDVLRGRLRDQAILDVLFRRVVF